MAALVQRLRAGDCDAVGGVVYFPDGRVESYGGHWGGWLASPRSIGYGAPLDAPVDAAAVERRLSYVSGASMMVGRRFLETVGPLREDYFLYCEEVEWFLRAAGLGMRLGFAPQARVMHEQGATTGSVPLLRERPRTPVYLDTRNKVLVTRDRFPGRLAVAVVAIGAIAALKCIKHGAWRQLAYALDGWRAGLLNERGAPAWLAD
jgi:N-acetylglucosaminyl-diphospho-decaprenol L-rhamnosyltransferase